MSMEAALKRLGEERLHMSQNLPQGFVAYPYRDIYGDFNLMKWECFVPGKVGTMWQHGRYKVKMVFNQCYPILPPACIFENFLYHPNICPAGRLYMSLLDFEEWTVTMTIRDILLRAQEILDKPELNYFVHMKAARNFKYDYPTYVTRVKAQVRRLRSQETSMWLDF